MTDDFPNAWRGVFVIFGVLIILWALLAPRRVQAPVLAGDSDGGLQIGDTATSGRVSPDGEIRIYHRDTLIYTIPSGKDEGER